MRYPAYPTSDNPIKAKFGESPFHELGSTGAETERTFRTSTTGVLVLVAWGTHLRHRPFREGGHKRCTGTAPQPVLLRGFRHPPQTSKPYRCLRALRTPQSS